MIGQQYDALILGGGLAGATMALLLARAGWSVAVLEKSNFPRNKVWGEFLSATNIQLLQELGIADAFSLHAGPQVDKVGLFAGRMILSAQTPQPHQPNSFWGWGHALRRERLDTMLLNRVKKVARRCGNPGKQLS